MAPSGGWVLGQPDEFLRLVWALPGSDVVENRQGELASDYLGQRTRRLYQRDLLRQ
jgi:hypothetical protein